MAFYGGMSQAASSGINIELGDQCSSVAFEWAQKTFKYREGKDGSADTRLKGSYSQIMNYGDVRLAMSSDGVGTKIEIAERAGIYHTLGFDLVAMVVDDLVCNGVEPANLSNILDVDYLDESIVRKLMEGLYEAAKVAKVSVTGGEIAELGSRIGGYGEAMHFNWGATGIGVLPSSRELIDGSAVRAGDTIITIKSRGLRSNGFSRARQLLGATFGDDWHKVMFQAEQSWGEALLTPALIYTPGILKLFDEGVPVHGLVHVTGGGIAGNLKRMLKANQLGAQLDSLFEPHPLMQALQKMGTMSDEEAYRLWNMGNGMLVIVGAEDKELVLSLLEQQGYKAQEAGTVVPEKIITLKTQTMHSDALIYESC